MIFPDDILQKQQYVHGIKYDIAITLCSKMPVIQHEFK